MKLKLLIGLLLMHVASLAQNVVSGYVENEQGNPIPYASILEKNTGNGTVADQNGGFYLRTSTAQPILVISANGYLTNTVNASGTNVKYVLIKSNKKIDNIKVVGSRNSERTKLNSIAPVDIINIREVTAKNGQLDINQLLQYTAPSFNSNRQSGSDGADHIDPATLRGLGPDQTLVLINGKRYHQSSLVNLYGSRGRGNNGTDLNTIPAAAVERIEILRDGAAAQYGSDAIAGVINIVLKENTNVLALNVSNGIYDASYNRNGKNWDGNNLNLSANYGIAIGKKSFVNITADFNDRDHTNRAATHPDSLIYRREFGDAKSNNIGLWLNSAYYLSDKSKLYWTAGMNKRKGSAFAWTRWADDDRNDPSIYPNGFDPIITSNILDYTTTLGVQSDLGKEIQMDLSLTTGKNRFDYGVENSLNRSMGSATPRSFDAGGFGLGQTTFNIDFDKKIKFAEGLNLAWGAEARLENFDIRAGQEESYKRYDTIHAPGSQGFPGFQPGDAIDKGRNSQALYIDGDLKVTDKWDIDAAIRYENYSDFGGALAYKLASRYELNKQVALRGCFNTGFRAPSLPQKYLNSTITNFVAGNAVDVLIARNGSAVATALGIPNLKKETSNNYSLGIVLKPARNFNITIDAYSIDVKDRIVLTGQFTDADSSIGSILAAKNVSRAQLFTNAVSTNTKGLDIVSNYSHLFNKSKLNLLLAANFNQLKIKDIYTNALLAGKEDTYFDLREQYFLRASAPPSKITFSTDYIYEKLTTTLRLTRFGAVTLANWNYDVNDLDVYSSKTTTDLSFTYKLNPSIQFTLGSSNLLNIYPDMHDPALTESGGAWDPVQMNYNGRFLFAKLRANINTEKKN